MNSPGDIEFLRRRSSDLQGVAYFQDWQAVMTGIGEPELMRTATVSDDFFSTLGISPAEGRAFLPEEHRRAAIRWWC